MKRFVIAKSADKMIRIVQSSSSGTRCRSLTSSSRMSAAAFNLARFQKEARYTSSVAAANVIEEEEEEEEEVTSPKARLADLRKRLREDALLMSDFQTSSITSSSSNKKQAKDTNVSDEEKDEKKNDVFYILKQLESMPSTPDWNDDKSKRMMLTDRYQRHHSYLRISLAERCNLRCQYCMPPEGIPLKPKSELLTRDEIRQLASLFVKAGVEKIRLTGGEPLLRHDIVDIVGDMSELLSQQQQQDSNTTTAPHVGMTTNGITLPRFLPDLVDAGLTHVNISLDTLDADKFQQLTRRPGLSKVLDALDVATCIPNLSVKLNCVVMRDFNTNELLDFVQLTTQYPNLDVRFIEWMPFADNGWNTNQFFSYQEMLNVINNNSKPTLERVQDGPNDTTKWWRIAKEEESTTTGRIGFITSMSEHFCGTCNRLRLTADGKLKVCLFDGLSEVSLRDALRGTSSSSTIQEGQLQQLIHYAVQRKKYALGGHENMYGIAHESTTNRPMTTIGG